MLERKPIKLDTQRIHQTILNKTVLVTGAAGSIGSEIVRQLTNFKPKLIILLDQAESALYELELEITEKLRFAKIEIGHGDVGCWYDVKWSVFEEHYIARDI